MTDRLIDPYGITLNLGDPMIRLFVPGRPIPKGSLAVGHTKTGKVFLRHSTDAGDLKTWTKTVATLGRLVMQRAHLQPVAEQAFFVYWTFIRNRPLAHRRADGTVKPQYARLLPLTRPDVDKLHRATADALEGIVWADDAQLTTVIACKRWGRMEGAQADVYRDYSDPDVETPANLHELIGRVM